MRPMRLGKVLVTGGAGFIGSQLLKRLVPICKRIYVVDDLSTGNLEAIPKATNITFIKDTILNEAWMEEILPRVDMIFHLACRNLLLSVSDLQSDLENNLIGGFRLLTKTKELCPRLKRFIYTSTVSVYGNANIIPTPEHEYNITLPYSASKLGVEHYCSVFHKLYRLPVTVLRLSNVFGPGQITSNPYCGVISKFFEQIINNKQITIYGDGTQTRDFTYITDAIDAITSVSLHPKAIGKLYNVGTGVETSINDLAYFIGQACGKKHEIIYERKRLADQVYRRAVNVHKIKSELLWSAEHSLSEGLTKTCQWLNGVDPS